MTYSIHPQAREEFKRAFARDETNEEGVGDRFSNEFYATLDRMISFPRAWPVFDNDERRVLFNIFPYSIIYSINKGQNECIIYAIMHQRQQPGYWKKRR